MKKSIILSILLVLCISSEILAQDNVFLSRGFWKSNPTVDQIISAIDKGNDPVALNKNAFDAVVYALLENVNNDAIKYLLSLEGNDVKKRTHDSRTYVFWAAYKGNVAIMKHLLDKGAAINITDSKGNTPVTFAASSGQKKPEVYNLFEKQGAILSAEANKNGVKVLFLVAPFLDNEEELSYFLDKGASLTELDPIGNTVFNHAAKNGNIEFLQLLVAKGVDPKKENEHGGNAMLYASQGTRSRQSSLETYKYLESLEVKVNVVGDNGRNPLHTIASRTEDFSVFKYFLEKDVAVNLKDNQGNFPFGNAAKSNDLKVIELLFKKVKDVNQKDGKGRSALALSVLGNSVGVVDFLLSKGADVQTKDAEGNSLLYYLVNSFEAKNPKVFDAKLQLLKTQGLQLNETQGGANTLLHIAAQQNDLTLLKRVSDFGIDVNAKNIDGYTALHISAMKSQDDALLKYLVSIGANTTIKTEFEETAFDLSSENEILKKQHIQLNFLK